MLDLYFLLLFLIQTSAKRMGCISNTTFVSTDITITQTNITFDQCACYQFYHNYSGFNYFAQNQTCKLFQNFTTDFTLVVNTQTQFCFINQPIRPTQFITTETTSAIKTRSTTSSVATTAIALYLITPHLITTALTSSIAHTTILTDVTTTVGELKWNSTGITVATGNGNNSILNPYGVFVDDQYYVYIAEKGNSRISKWPPNPTGSASAAIWQTASGQLNQPLSLYVNSSTGNIYVVDASNLHVMVFANGSTTGTNVASPLSGISLDVNAIYLDPNGTIFVADSDQNRIYNWLTNQTEAGGQGTGLNANQLNQPKRFFIDSNYSFYIADSGNNRVQKWLRGSTSGVTVAGGYGPGSNSSQLSGPLGVVVDSHGNVLVCDSNNNRVQKWSPGATTGQTVAGNGNSTAGSGPNELNTPKAIALDKENNLYVADTNNLRIQKFNVL